MKIAPRNATAPEGDLITQYHSTPDRRCCDAIEIVAAMTEREAVIGALEGAS